MARDWEQALREWSKPAGESEQERCENAGRMTKEAVQQSRALKGKTIEVFAQGLYCNGTNVRMDSDVDICACRMDPFLKDFSMAQGFTKEDVGLTEKIVEQVKLGEPISQGGTPLLGLKASEILESFFRDIAPPRLESSGVLRKAIARGVTEGTLAYTSGSQPTLGADGKFQVSHQKVVFQRPLAEDEVDFESGFVMVPGAVPDAAAMPEAAPTAPGVPAPTPGMPTQPATPNGAPAPIPGAPVAAERQNTVHLTFKATRDQIFKAFPAIANLADKSDERKVTISVQGTSSEGFDPSWLRNAVDEPLDEANIEKLPEDQSLPRPDAR